MAITLSEIWVYPVKSLGGIRLTKALTEERGLRYDRRWMIIDEENVFITQRTHLKMALIDVALEEGGLKIYLRADPADFVLVPYQPATALPVTVQVWDDTAEALTVSDEADAWLTRQLDMKLRLVVMPDSTERKADPRYARHNENVSFADGFPYLVISQASLDDLNGRLAEPIEMRRFRPNFVISGTEPFAEDQWKHITIGDLRFEVVKPCARCVLTTINPETAEKGAEPLKTLASYRRNGNKILFGQNVTAQDFGELNIGDQVLVLE
ncbi:MOSC domain-containing protein [Dyadobacter fermentans]|uniref:MOSC domain-containing protein n=1 Tax=Dyadobacter fermentans TaxID=94254 RepID=UPI001CC020EC|nr:MOSC N-terminal beta barrel domain-containing protein [Dyadobacter fermentans]MBZ1357005.1 MOSC domain-containing protein [Dyadobacter fermentans]